MPGTPEGCLLNRLSRSGQVGSVLNELLQPLQPGLEVGVLCPDLSVLLLQSLHGDHQDPRHVAGVDGRRRSNGPYAVVPEGSEEVLGRGLLLSVQISD